MWSTQKSLTLGSPCVEGILEDSRWKCDSRRAHTHTHTRAHLCVHRSTRGSRPPPTLIIGENVRAAIMSIVPRAWKKLAKISRRRLIVMRLGQRACCKIVRSRMRNPVHLTVLTFCRARSLSVGNGARSEAIDVSSLSANKRKMNNKTERSVLRHSRCVLVTRYLASSPRVVSLTTSRWGDHL